MCLTQDRNWQREKQKKTVIPSDSKSVERQNQNPDNGGTGSQFGRRGQFAETGSNSFVCRLQSDNWTGKFLDSTINKKPLDYDAFNYEISGNGEGKVTVTLG